MDWSKPGTVMLLESTPPWVVGFPTTADCGAADMAAEDGSLTSSVKRMFSSGLRRVLDSSFQDLKASTTCSRHSSSSAPVPEVPTRSGGAIPGQFAIAVAAPRHNFAPALADGVKVAQGSLEPLVMVRIHVGQPLGPKTHQTFWERSISRSEVLRIFPVALRGSAGRGTTRRGTL